MVKSLLVSCGFLIALSAWSVEVLAAGNPPGGILVSPARIVATVCPGDPLPPLRVKNRMDKPVELTVYVGRGEHRLDGSPLYLDSPADRLWGAEHLQVDRTELLLAPGETAEVNLRVGTAARVVGGFYPVIYLEMRSEAGPGVTGLSRLAVITMLEMAGTKPNPADLCVTTLQVEQVHPGAPIGIYPIVTNHGNTHGSLHGYINIADGEDQQLARLPVAPTTVLPGLSRRLDLAWCPPELPVGMYRVQAELFSHGRAIPSHSMAFHVSQPYALATVEGDRVSSTPGRMEAQL